MSSLASNNNICWERYSGACICDVQQVNIYFVGFCVKKISQHYFSVKYSLSDYSYSISSINASTRLLLCIPAVILQEAHSI